MEFIVVRQFTTTTSGYFTKLETAMLILTEGVSLTIRVAPGQQPPPAPVSVPPKTP